MSASIQSTSLSIFSLNIEQDCHLDQIISFLENQKPDVILLQEVLDKDLATFENALGIKSIFAVQNILLYEGGAMQLGMATFLNLPIIREYSAYYRGNGADPVVLRLEELNMPETALRMGRAILVTEFIKDNQSYCVINTHFTWTPDGKSNVQQMQDLPLFLQLLSEIPEFILCGDFNAPRGGVVFDTIAAQYKDNIPVEVHTTIDKNLHKAGPLNLVVDGIFTTPKYCVHSVQIIDGLSDHCAILAKVN